MSSSSTIHRYAQLPLTTYHLWDKLNIINHTIFDYQVLERVLLELGMGHPINSSALRI